jgi:hypothetical protein
MFLTEIKAKNPGKYICAYRSAIMYVILVFGPRANLLYCTTFAHCKLLSICSPCSKTTYIMYSESERLERGGPCWLLKLRQMRTQSEQMMFVGIFILVHQSFVLPWLIYSDQYKLLFSSPFTISLSPSPSKLGRQSCGVADLLMYVSGQSRLQSRSRIHEHTI